MQDVNNDMDNLLRRAAEQYPLKTDGADWQKILAGLQDDDAPAAIVTGDNEKRKKRVLWLLLLLPLALLYTPLQNYFEHNHKQVAVTKKEIQTKSKKTQTKIADINNHLLVKEQNTRVNNSVEEQGNNKISDDIKNESGLLPNANHLHSKKREAGVSTKNNLSNNVPAFLRSEKENKETNKADVDMQNAAQIINDNNIVTGKNNIASAQPIAVSPRIQSMIVTDSSLVNDDNKAPVAMQQKHVVDDKITKDKKDSTATAPAQGSSKKIKVKMQWQPGFYAGLLGSFDLSTIKLQRIKKTGYGVNILAGYRLSKRVSVESGINWSQKKYYSTGKYFDKTNTGISPQSKIIYTNGTCSMFEIPVVMKYDFRQKPKSNLFVTAGLFSYIMKEEKYSYYANHGGNYYSATKSYRNSGNNPLSVAGFSIGYQLRLSEHISLRAEPYIKMPLTGIGIANLPITSAGITAGFTRSF